MRLQRLSLPPLSVPVNYGGLRTEYWTLHPASSFVGVFEDARSKLKYEMRGQASLAMWRRCSKTFALYRKKYRLIGRRNPMTYCTAIIHIFMVFMAST